jgi:EAL domain-containing protein (putative c-di-GMP-specific phosphodiesterase class I)
VAPHITLAVNVSGRQFNTRKLQTCLESALAASGLTPRRLTLEVTESVLMQNLETTLEIMHWLEGKGIELAVDDFGTGYSSLTYLKKFPVRQLKIDQAFVRGIHQDPHDAVIVSAIIGMAHNLGMEVIAEGVEEEEELQFLKMRGCQNFQGFYFSRPRSWDEVVPMILSGKVVASHASSP